MNWKNDPLLCLPKYEFLLKDNYVNVYRVLILENDFRGRRWMVKTPYIAGKVITSKARKILLAINNWRHSLELLAMKIEEYSGYSYFEYTTTIRTLEKQFRRNMLNLVVLRCISLLGEAYLNKPSNDIFLELLKEAEYYRGCFRNYNPFRLPMMLDQILSDPSIYIAGVISGDGHICKTDLHVEISSGNQDENLRKFSNLYLQKLRRLVRKNCGTKSFIRHRTADQYFLNITSKWFGVFYHRFFGIPIGNKAEIIEVPRVLSLLPRVERRKKLCLFWRGLFDTDGGVNSDMSSFQISITSKSKNILESFNQFGRDIDIVCSPVKEGSDNVYKIFIPTAGYLSFCEKIGSYNPVKSNIITSHLLKGPTELMFYGQNKSTEYNGYFDLILLLGVRVNNMNLKFRKLRQELSKNLGYYISQKKLGEMLDKSQYLIYKAETGGFISLQLFVKLAELCGYEKSDVYYWLENNSKFNDSTSRKEVKLPFRPSTEVTDIIKYLRPRPRTHAVYICKNNSFDGICEKLNSIFGLKPTKNKRNYYSVYSRVLFDFINAFYIIKIPWNPLEQNEVNKLLHNWNNM